MFGFLCVFNVTPFLVISIFLLVKYFMRSACTPESRLRFHCGSGHKLIIWITFNRLRS